MILSNIYIMRGIHKIEIMKNNALVKKINTNSLGMVKILLMPGVYDFICVTNSKYSRYNVEVTSDTLKMTAGFCGILPA